MSSEEARQKIIVAVDASDVDEALEIISELSDHVGRFKIGFEFIFAMLVMLITPNLATARTNLSKIRRLFGLLKGRMLLDCKLADIPNTMENAVLNIVKLMVWAFNFHVSAGEKSARAAVVDAGDCQTFGVTVLTSIGTEECMSIFGQEPNDMVEQFSRTLVDINATGVICSAQEGPYLRGTAVDDAGELLPDSDERKERFANLEIATPGIRPLWARTDDQQRVVTPHQAININGVTYVIIGRPITQPPAGFTRVQAAQLVAQEIAEGCEITKADAIALIPTL